MVKKISWVFEMYLEGYHSLLPLEGENQLDFLHPSLASRISKLNNALAKREAHIQDDQENQKISLYKKTLKETM